MDYTLDIRGNALDSLAEAMIRFHEGENGRIASLKYAVLHVAHFAELSLKLYIESLQPELVFRDSFEAVKERARKEAKEKERKEGKKRAGKEGKETAGTDDLDLLSAYRALRDEGFNFASTLEQKGKSKGPEKTILARDALHMALGEEVYGQKLIDERLSGDLLWTFDLRNAIMHYQFTLGAVETRLTMGRVLQGMIEFHDIFDLLNIKKEVDPATMVRIDKLAGEYQHKIAIAAEEVKQAREQAYSVSPKDRVFVDWEALDCPECGQPFLIPTADSDTGWRCTLCENEESDLIPNACDLCGSKWPNESLAMLEHEDGTCSSICPQCSGDDW